MTVTTEMKLESTNPATGEVVGTVPVTPVIDIPGSVAKARAAQKAGNDLGLYARVEMLRPVAARLAEEAPARFGGYFQQTDPRCF